MTLLQKLILILALGSALTVGYGFLPDGSDYPIPEDLVLALNYFASALGAVNEFLPADTLFELVIYATIFRLARFILWPIFLYVTNLISKLI